MTHLHRLRRLVALFAVSSLIVSSLPAAAHEPPEIVFPVLADTQYVDSFGDPRPGGRSHEGTDIMTPAKGDPVVATTTSPPGPRRNRSRPAIDHDDTVARPGRLGLAGLLA